MKRSFLGSLAAAALMLASAAQPSATATAKASADVRAQRTDTTSRAPQAPEQPATAAAKQMRFNAQPLLAMGGPGHYSDVARPRRVKYGKSRWIVLS
jgi:hypothetical protein